MAVDPVSLAITAALTAANMAITASQTIEGPRVKGAPATVADYGAPLNYFLGTRLLNCPCFFAQPITEVRKKRKGKGGKQVTYTGFGSFAIHIADHEIGGVLQVWFDNHLVYDNTGSEEKIYPLADDYEIEAHMRVYLGTETQDPDPDMLAYIEARDGADMCPAYRGTSYIYFEGIPLEMLGNRYPDVKVLAYQNSALTVPDTADISLVGTQGLATTNGAAVGPIAFALTGGLDTTPSEGDVVLIAISSVATYSDPGDVTPSVPGYTQLFEPVEVAGTVVRPKLGLGVYYKEMTATPDTTWSANGSGAAGSRGTAYLVVVLRGVDAANILPVPAETVSVSLGAALDPPDIDIDGAPYDPGTLATSSFARPYAGASWAIKSTTGNYLPMMAGAAWPDDNYEVGNMTTVHQQDTGGAASTSVGLVYGDEIMIGEGTTLGAILTFLSERAGLDADEYNYGLVSGADHALDGFSWAQSGGQQADALCDLFDVDIRPHEFAIQALPRGSTSEGAIPTTEFVAGEVPYTLPDRSDSSLPARVFLTYADTGAEQNPNVAMPQGGEFSGGEISIDMQTLALTATRAQQLTERRQRRERFGRITAEMALTRQRFALEPGDVFTPSFDGEAMTMRCTKLTVGADGKFQTEWSRDDPAIAILPSAVGAPAAGIIPDTMPDAVGTEGYVLDTAYLTDADDQSAPLVYLVAGPDEPGIWTGADYAASDTGDLDSYAEGWDGIGADYGSILGTTTGALADNALPWVPDNGSSVEVTITTGELTAATLDELILDGTLNLCAIQSGDGWELLQFTTATLTAPFTYTLTGFLRGVRGTEWAMAGHAPADVFVLLDNAKLKTLGASEIGDEDFYVVSTVGQEVDQTTAFSVDYTGASHKPYAPVLGELTFDTGVTDDITIDAVRRTRIGGATLDGQDVPLGEASQSWSADIYDGVTFKRTITGTSLPLTYTAADQTTDFGAPVTTGFEVYLYQVNPTLSLRGYPLALAA